MTVISATLCGLVSGICLAELGAIVKCDNGIYAVCFGERTYGQSWGYIKPNYELDTELIKHLNVITDGIKPYNAFTISALDNITVEFESIDNTTPFRLAKFHIKNNEQSLDKVYQPQPKEVYKLIELFGVF